VPDLGDGDPGEMLDVVWVVEATPQVVSWDWPDGTSSTDGNWIPQTYDSDGSGRTRLPGDGQWVLVRWRHRSHPPVGDGGDNPGHCPTRVLGPADPAGAWVGQFITPDFDRLGARNRAAA
jgi:hypothetical protein